MTSGATSACNAAWSLVAKASLIAAPTFAATAAVSFGPGGHAVDLHSGRVGVVDEDLLVHDPAPVRGEQREGRVDRVSYAVN